MPRRFASRRPRALTRCAAEPLEWRVLFSTYTVTTLGDGAGSVAPAAPGAFTATTLRAALAAANAHKGADTVNFRSGLAGTIRLAAVLPIVSDSLTLTGPGAPRLTIARRAEARRFSVLRIDGGITAAVSGLTLTGGSADVGGGIANSGNLTARGVTLTGNSANNGGAVSNGPGATLTLQDCTVARNKARDPNDQIFGGGAGGGIYALGGTITLVRTAVVANLAGAGGGIAPLAGTVMIRDSTIAGNTATFADAGGGGIFSGATLTIVNSTVSGNTTPGLGGGISAVAGSVDTTTGQLTLVNTTIADNRAADAGGLFFFSTVPAITASLTHVTLVNNRGGGVHVFGGRVKLSNSIVARNIIGPGAATAPTDILLESDLGGAIDPASAFNLIGTGGSGGLKTGANGNRVGVADPKLGPLANNGGPTRTIALLPGSPAVNVGSNALAVGPDGKPLATDQRGIGSPRVVGGRVDVGAFERQ